MPHKLYPPGERGEFWYCRGRITINNRIKRFEFSCRTLNRKEAEAVADREIAKLHSHPLAGNKPVTFAGAAEIYIGFRDPPKDDLKYLKRLIKHFGDTPLADIRSPHVHDAANTLLPGRAGRTKNRQVIAPTSVVMHYANEAGWVDYRKFKYFPIPKRSPRNPAKDEDMAKLLAGTTGHKHLLLSILYETGLRISDVIRLNDDNMRLADGVIYTRTKKTDGRMEIPISPSLVAKIANGQRFRGGKVFPWSWHYPIYKWLHPLCKAVGVAYYSPHMSRHALATDLLRRGIPDKAAAAYGGWEDERSLRNYQHTQPGRLPDRTVDRLLGETGGTPRQKRRKSAI